MKAGKWEKSKFIGAEVCNKMLGIVGIGNIGSLVAERALGLQDEGDRLRSRSSPRRRRASWASSWSTSTTLLHARRLHHDPHAAAARDARPDRRRGAREDEATACAHQLRARRHRRRGGAGRRACATSSVAGAALDVFEQEPPPTDHPLLQLDQVICTPHLGAATAEAQVNVADRDRRADRRLPRARRHPQRGQRAVDQRRAARGAAAVPDARREARRLQAQLLERGAAGGDGRVRRRGRGATTSSRSRSPCCRACSAACSRPAWSTT